MLNKAKSKIFKLPILNSADYNDWSNKTVPKQTRKNSNPFGHNMCYIEVLLIANIQTIRPKKKPVPNRIMDVSKGLSKGFCLKLSFDK